jgi:hypothetical protein
MSNSPETPETQNVVIENVTPDSMKVNVNGEVKEIKNTLDELKVLFKSLNVENFKSGDKIYNIGTITNATFSAEIGKKTFNMYLCRKLTEALRDYSPDAKAFLENIKEADKADWESQVRYTRKANPYIISGFVGVLGILIQKLIASGQEAFKSNNAKDYLEVCIATVQRALQLLCYSFVSKLWDYKKDNNCEFTRDQANDLDNFFNTDIELNITDYVELLKTLVSIFDAQKIEYPFNEFNKDCLKNESSFIKACKNLKEINNKLDNGQFTLPTAFEAENELTVFLTTLNFLAAYKMVSVKDISYEEIRNKDAQYLHSYTFLGVDSDNTLYSSKYKYDSLPISSDAVLIFKNKYQEGLNLFPFIIDINALINEMEVKICFYTYFEEGKKKLTYSDINKISSDKNESVKDISDPSLVSIIYNEEVENDLNATADHDITRLKKDIKKFHDLKLNTLYKIFQNAKKEILE